MVKNACFLKKGPFFSRVLTFSLLLLSYEIWAQKDLPNPPANFQSIPAGSYIIPMDNLYQSIVPVGQAPFNLKAYGLVNEFLQNGIPVRWAINSNKQLDGIDFTAIAERFSPGYIAAASIDFRGGPFIVPDTVLPCGQSTSQIINTYGNNVATYRLVNTTVVDIRYNITNRPKIAVFNNGGNQLIHTKILDAAGIGNYDIIDAAHIDELKNCYTFASEPHADSSQVSQSTIDGVKAFVMSGGNFLAQCHAIDTYENRGFFHTTGGIKSVNTTVDHLYPNANLAFTQINGVTMENSGGSVDNYTLKNGSSWRPYVYPSITFLGKDTVVAMGAHLLASNAPGGNVYYLGGHDYSKKGGANTVPNLTNIANVNALRLYLNAALVPSGTTHGTWANAGDPIHFLSCNDKVTLGCSETGPPGSTYLWTPSTGLSCTTCPNPVASPTVSTTYKLQVSNTCIATDTVRIIVAPKPLAQFTNTTVCVGASTTFTNQSTNSTFWQWNFGDPASGSGNLSSLQNPTHTFSTSGNFTVTLISGIDPACSDTITYTVTVKPLPVVTVNSDTICQGQSLTLTASGASTYSWSTGATANSITVKPGISTNFIVTGTLAGCSSSDTAIITVSLPMIPLTSQTNVSCFGGSNGSASVIITGGIPEYTYSWNTSPIQTTIQAINLSKGTYTVTIKDHAGCSATSIVTITEPTQLSATTVSTDAKCNGKDGSAKVTATGGTPSYSYSWNTIPIQTTIQAANLPSGNYTVTITDTNGCTTTAFASIAELPGISLTTTESNVSCNGGTDGSASVIATGGTPGYTYSWNTTPVQTTSQAINLQAGTYTVTVTDVNQCQQSISTTVTEPEPIVANTLLTHPTCVTNGSATATVSGGTWPYSYSWNSTPAQTTSTAVNLPSGDYILTVADAHNCHATFPVTLHAPLMPIADFIYFTGCVGSQARFEDNSSISAGTDNSTIISQEWNFGDPASGIQNVSFIKNPSHTFNSATTFLTQLIVTTNQGCKDTITKPVEVFPIPVVRFGPFAEGCESICVDFKDSSTVAGGSIDKWLWTFGDLSSSDNTSSNYNPTHCFNKPGSYDVTLQIFSNHGCAAELTINDLIHVHKSPVVNLGPDHKICPENIGEVPITLNAGPGAHYSWLPGGDTTQVVTVSTPGVYSVKVTNQEKCSALASVNVREVCPPRLFLGNAFSPDNDGINDLHTVYHEHVGKFQMLIFNRWGEIIFESRDKNHHWDGIYKGEPMPIGVYAWVITYEGAAEEYRGPYKLEGSVTVVR